MKVPLIATLMSMVLLFVFKNTRGQNAHQNIFQVRIAPLNLFDPYTGVIQLGLQKRFSHRLALSSDYGLRFNKLSFSVRHKERLDYRYYKAKAQVKYYFKTNPTKPDIFSNPYVAVEAFYFPQQYRKVASYLVRDSLSYRYQQSNINRKAKSFALQIGDERIFKLITLDYYIGAGIRWLYIAHQTVGEVEMRRPEPRDIGRFEPIDEQQGIFIRPHLSLGFKVGYILLK